jgi:hypothetical protein
VAALRTDARLIEYPVWFWHHGEPKSAPWPLLRRLPLGRGAAAAKRAALEAHRSQVAPLSDAPGDEALLHPGVLSHFERGHETFVVGEEPVAVDLFERPHHDDTAPWAATECWYEHRKRALTLAALPHERFRRALEIGRANDALTRELATRCDEVVSADPRVLTDGAAYRSPAGTGLPLAEHVAPQSWPAGEFDLVVVSEVGYLLSPSALRSLTARVRDCLSPDGVLVLCHWRHPVAGWPLDGERVHEIVREGTDLPRIMDLRDEHFILDVHAHRCVDDAGRAVVRNG